MMQSKYDIVRRVDQEEAGASQEMLQLLETFLAPLLYALDLLLDKRLVETLVHSCVAIIRFRSHKQALWLSELGSYLPAKPGQSRQGPAGTKRIGNLIRSLKWSIGSIDRFLLEEADKTVIKLKREGKRILCPWDESSWEKPESEKLEGLCGVVSSKAKRLHRWKKGITFNFPPKKAITVTGMEWTGALITGMEGEVKVAMMSWWTKKGDYATKLRVQQEKLLRQVVRQWGNLLLHIFDQGASSGPWLQVLEQLRVFFLIRWQKKHHFFDATGVEKKLWEIGRGKKYYSHKEIHDLSTGQKMPCDIWWAPVRHEDYTQQLYLVKVRVKKEVMYLVTNLCVRTEEQAWEMVFAYRRRWQIELAFRYNKSELALESPRVYGMENRLKLLGIVTLIYAFFLYLIFSEHQELIKKILRLKCHRTGARCREALVPLYRLRWALSRLWDDSRPALGLLLAPTSGTLQALATRRC
jgi:Transposase DDE domain